MCDIPIYSSTYFFFFFSSRRRHTRCLSDWSSDVCSSDLLLTHYSGLPPDVDLKDAWGLAKPDKAEGILRAMNATLASVPGTKFVYSDVNFITLGALVEKVSGETLDRSEEHTSELQS